MLLLLFLVLYIQFIINYTEKNYDIQISTAVILFFLI